MVNFLSFMKHIFSRCHDGKKMHNLVTERCSSVSGLPGQALLRGHHRRPRGGLECVQVGQPHICQHNIMQTCSGWERTVYGKPVWEHYLAKSNCSYCTLVSVILYNTFYSLSHVPLACSSWVHSWSETVAGSCTQSFWSICKDFQFSLTLGGLNCSLRPLIILAERWAVQSVKQLILQYFDRCILTAEPHK